MKPLKFASFMLFQFKTVANGLVNKKRICEERIYHIYASSADKAYSKANQIGKEEEFSYKDGDKLISFEFIGIIDLIELSCLEDKNLIWSRFVEKLYPMERKDKIIPEKDKLTVFNSNSKKLKL